jgi:TPR repeat protein
VLARKWIELADAPRTTIGRAADEELGRGYAAFYGERRKRDVRAAVRSYRVAAEQGHPSAWINLALCYLQGHGVARDRERAFDSFVRAARLGHDRAKLRVAAPARESGC